MWNWILNDVVFCELVLAIEQMIITVLLSMLVRRNWWFLKGILLNVHRFLNLTITIWNYTVLDRVVKSVKRLYFSLLRLVIIFIYCARIIKNIGIPLLVIWVWSRLMQNLWPIFLTCGHLNSLRGLSIALRLSCMIVIVRIV